MSTTSSFGERHKNAISFCVITPDRAILPCYDVARANLDNITPTFHREWLDFCAEQRWQGDLETTLRALIARQHTIERRDEMIIMLPEHFLGGFLKNEPDLYDCDAHRVLSFLQRSEMCLNDIRLRTSPQQRLIFAKVHPYTFLNLSVTRSSDIARFAAQNSRTNPTVWCAIIAWWNYHNSDDNKDEDDNNQSGSEEFDLVALIEAHCKALLLSRCDFFLMIWSAAFRIGDLNLRTFCERNLCYVNLDDDLIADTPQYCLHILGDQRLDPTLDRLVQHRLTR